MTVLWVGLYLFGGATGVHAWSHGGQSGSRHGHGASYHTGYHYHSGTSVFVGGFFGVPFYDPFFYYPYYAPYPYPYAYYPYPLFQYPPPPAAAAADPGAPSEPDGPRDEPASGEALAASYGLVQLRGVPDGAAIDLDGRFWLTAQQLDQRWLALPHGEHTLAVRVRGAEPLERHLTVAAGRTQVVRLGPFPRRPS